MNLARSGAARVPGGTPEGGDLPHAGDLLRMGHGARFLVYVHHSGPCSKKQSKVARAAVWKPLQPSGWRARRIPSAVGGGGGGGAEQRADHHRGVVSAREKKRLHGRSLAANGLGNDLKAPSAARGGVTDGWLRTGVWCVWGTWWSTMTVVRRPSLASRGRGDRPFPSRHRLLGCSGKLCEGVGRRGQAQLAAGHPVAARPYRQFGASPLNAFAQISGKKAQLLAISRTHSERVLMGSRSTSRGFLPQDTAAHFPEGYLVKMPQEAISLFPTARVQRSSGAASCHSEP